MAHDESAVDSLRGARLLGVGTAVPDLCWLQAEAEQVMAHLWGLKGVALARWRKIIAGTEIQTRHAVHDVEHMIHWSTAQRMDAYERFAPGLAHQAALKALQSSGVAARQITDLIVVSCTGFSAPGVDVELVQRLALRLDVRRTMIGFMGCFGAISGLRTAVGACAANPNAVVLVVCVELCSLHLRADCSVQNQVASALFADGAAAAVVQSREAVGVDDESEAPFIGRLTTGATRLIPERRDWMTWRITDNGFAMTLSREVPTALQDCLADFVAHAYGDQPPESFVIHPGGPGILDAADEALGLCGGRGLDASRSVLSRHGNMSSATVLFVLEESLRRGIQLPALLLAFGPGLTIESLLLGRKQLR